MVAIRVAPAKDVPAERQKTRELTFDELGESADNATVPEEFVADRAVGVPGAVAVVGTVIVETLVHSP